MIIPTTLGDARPLRLFWVCDHEPWHRHIGTMGGTCDVCKSTWCTIRAYDCELAHYPRKARRR